MSENPPVTSSDTPTVIATPESESPVRYGSLGDRLIGLLVDGLVAFGLFFLLGMLIAPRFGGATASGFELSGAPAIAVIGPVTILTFAYFVLLESAFGATLGKLVAGIQVQDVGGGRPSLRAALVRNLMRVIDSIGAYLVAAIAVLVTKRNQRLGDLVAHTVVVSRAKSRLVRVAALIAALAIAVGGVVGGFILRDPVSAAGQPRYASLVLTDDPVRSVARTEFPADTPRIFVVFTLADVPENTTLRSVWIAENVANVPRNTPIDEAELRGGGRNQGNFSLSRPTAGWPSGSYRVELYLADQLAATLPFTVTGPPTQGASPPPQVPAGVSPAASPATATGR
jgi:uncharacterized RDD family membrane protein YckC